ncbi:TAXI family TRAP transporter solute-binding subunit [Xanthobacteraceae bacterium Astr-EGSB]|uniref:TAXI family TRAP transporter solute-binding subunit n=1 Tax=Astrobacterium formosum TaxID=3069710 RepID=UPI0027B1CD4F|nr:TAXI family TRAP transporter solute-binding subunit [Xanthobacteraceae bacterium Astr-EGSB]
MKTIATRNHWVAASLGAGLAIAFAAAAPAAEIKLMTGPQGGVWVPLGGQLKDMWEKAVPGLSVQSLPGAGIANVRGVDEGKADAGFGNSISTVDGLKGNAPFPRAATNVCNVATLYPQYYQLVVRADAGINSVKDLKGKGVTTQQRGNTGELITGQLLKVNGLAYNDVKASFVSYTDSVTQVQDGHAVAFGLGTTIPSGAVMDLAAARDVKILDLSDQLGEMKKLNPGYTLVTIPKGTYPKQNADVKVIGYATHIVVSCKLPEDMVYRMTKAMADNIKSMAAVNKAMEKLTPKDMAEDIGVPFHPGAARYFKEAGIAVATN